MNTQFLQSGLEEINIFRNSIKTQSYPNPTCDEPLPSEEQEMEGQFQMLNHQQKSKLQKYPSHSFQEHSKIETTTPSESLVDFPHFFQNAQDPQNAIGFYESQKEIEEHLQQEIAYLREENAMLKEELEEIKVNYEQFMRKQQSSKPIYSSEDVNRLIEENHALEEIEKKLTQDKRTQAKEIQMLEDNLLEISNSNQDYYKKVVSITNDLERERREFRAHLKEFEDRLHKNLEKEQKKYNALAQELSNQKEENENLRTIMYESNEQLAKLKKNRGQLEEECENLMREKDELGAYIQERENSQNQQENYELHQMLHGKNSEIEQLREELELFEEENKKLQQECQRYQHLFETELIYSEQKDTAIKNLTLQLEKGRLTERKMHSKSSSYSPLPVSSPSNPITYNLTHNNNPMYNKASEQGSNSCSASSANRIKVLCNESTRKNIMRELKMLIKDISKIELENKISSLLHELYMDAEYRERTNMQMQEIIVQLEQKITLLQRGKQPSRKMDAKSHNNQAYFLNLQSSLERYEKLLLNADTERLKLIDEISLLKKENYQIRLQLSNSQLDNQTEELIEQLTLQLQQQKYNNKILEEENEVYQEEIRSIEKQLNEKNKRIKLLTLNLNKKYPEGEGKNQAFS